MARSKTDNTATTASMRTMVPEPTLRRLPWYLSNVKVLLKSGESYVSTRQIARAIGMEAAQIAKDLSFLRIAGRTRVGYRIDELIAELERFLGFTTLHRAVLFGVGNFGAALLQDKDLLDYGLEIVAAFDVRPEVIGTSPGGIRVSDIRNLGHVLEKTPAEIGILAVPIDLAQEVADMMVTSGLRSIWNFTPYRVRVPQDVVVQNTSVYAHLALMYHRQDFKPVSE